MTSWILFPPMIAGRLIFNCLYAYEISSFSLKLRNSNLLVCDFSFLSVQPETPYICFQSEDLDLSSVQGNFLLLFIE